MSKKVKAQVAVADELAAAVAALPTTSAKIRYLTAQNFTRSQVSEYLQIRYQHVRNVLITPLKSASK